MTDAVVLASLATVPHLTVYDGKVDADEAAKVIAVPLPYVVFWSSPGYDNDERFDGRANGRVLEFQLTGVGETREQAKAVLDRARQHLNRRRIGRGLCKRSDDNQMVRRDDTYTRPGGGPLFYGVDRYTLPI
jgi:hypothetical protein